MSSTGDRTVTQRWDPEAYAGKVRFISRLGAPLIDMLQPQPVEKILDLGCGDGDLTEVLAGSGADVLGLDSSEAFVAAAEKRGLKAIVADAHRLDFDAEFDAVLSNAALHWMLDPDAVIAGVFRALKPGGRFVAECGGHTNVAAIRAGLYPRFAARGLDPAQYDPWYFPSAAEYRERLQRANFHVDSIELFPRPVQLDHGIEVWARNFLQSWLAVIPDAERDAFLQQCMQGWRPMLCDAKGIWTVDYVRLRFKARKPL